jgi:hypothetical protein
MAGAGYDARAENSRTHRLRVTPEPIRAEHDIVANRQVLARRRLRQHGMLAFEIDAVYALQRRRSHSLRFRHFLSSRIAY